MASSNDSQYMRISVEGKGRHDIRYNINDKGSAEINAYDMANMLEAVNANNFKETGLKFKGMATLTDGSKKEASIVLSEKVMNASPKELREIGDKNKEEEIRRNLKKGFNPGEGKTARPKY